MVIRRMTSGFATLRILGQIRSRQLYTKHSLRHVGEIWPCLFRDCSGCRYAGSAGEQQLFHAIACNDVAVNCVKDWRGCHTSLVVAHRSPKLFDRARESSFAAS